MVLGYTDIMILVWVMWGASFTMTIARGGLRWYSQQQLFADDYFVFGGLLTLTGLSAVITRLLPQFYLTAEYMKAMVANPLTPLPLPQEEFVHRTETSLKLMFSQMLLFWSTLWAAKFSLLFFFQRLVIGLPKYMRIWWAVFMTVLLLYLACMISNFTTCVPLKKYWSATGCSAPEDPKRSDKSIRFATAADVAADCLIMLLPLNLLRNLQISASQKFGLATIFSLGSIIIAFAVVRLMQVTKATSQASIDVTTTANGPILLSMWSDIESAVSIIVATLPAFRFLLNGKIGRTGAGATRYYGSAAAGYGSGVKGGKRNVLNTVRSEGGRGIKLGSLCEREGSVEFGSQTGFNLEDGISKQLLRQVGETR
ncbi:hypothetical protein AOQ84DRAFT_401401 [Glonium stellatum]|uniref:Rhodopsin domain-containing protein n=1 Tax=Glonium stellatum TaxID=574774 RepID=A0A8E2EPQ6_9PEZI|nr:hypothetical protein AOQ84DRAFT_401401 [Glonium stellatum]